MPWDTQRALDGTPVAAVLTTTELRVTVHRHQDFQADIWVMSVSGGLQLGPRGLLALTLEAAQLEALVQLRVLMRRYADELLLAASDLVLR